MGKVEEKLMKEEKSEDTGKWLHLSIFVTESDDNRNSANDKIAASDSWLPLYSRLCVLLDHICIAIGGGLGGVVVIDAAIGVHGRGSRLAHYFTVAATLDKSLTSH